MNRLASFLALLSALHVFPLGAADLSKLTPWSGGATPKLALKDLNGKKQDLAHYRGKVVVVNFWATWCAPCVKEMPSLQRLADKLAGQRFAVLTVNFGEGEDQVKSFVRKLRLKLPVLLDRDMAATHQWVEKGLPTTYVIDGQQKIRYQVLGDLDWDNPAVESRIRALIPPS